MAHPDRLIPPEQSPLQLQFHVGAHIIPNKEHEDLYCADRAFAQTFAQGHGAVFAITDGTSEGGRASEEAAEHVHRAFRLTAEMLKEGEFDNTQGLPTLMAAHGIMVATTSFAADAIRELQGSRKSKADTVLTAGITCWDPDKKIHVMLIGHAGNTRLYRHLLGTKQLQQLTRDDTLVQAQVDAGLISTLEAFSDPQRNYITNYASRVDATGYGLTIYRKALVRGCVYLGETDGLHGSIYPDNYPTIVANRIIARTSGGQIDTQGVAEDLCQIAHIQPGEPDDRGAVVIYPQWTW